MISQNGDIQFKDLILGDTSTLHIAIKSMEGKLYLDARKWYQYGNLDHPIASKKGLMLDMESWSKAIPMIEALIKDNDCKQS